MRECTCSHFEQSSFWKQADHIALKRLTLFPDNVISNGKFILIMSEMSPTFGKAKCDQCVLSVTKIKLFIKCRVNRTRD